MALNLFKTDVEVGRITIVCGNFEAQPVKLVSLERFTDVLISWTKPV